MSVASIVCVWTGKAFGFEYIEKLFNMVTANWNAPTEFWCICDKENAYQIHTDILGNFIQTYEIDPAKYPRWWGKMILFDSRFQEKLKGDILYFDLDTVICGNINDYMTKPTNFTILENFLQPPVRNPGVTPCKFGSAVMYIPKNIWCDIAIRYNFNREVIQEKYARDGDQYFIEHCVENHQYCLPDCVDTWQDLFPGEFRSVKYPEKLTELPKGCKVVCYHGSPRPHEDLENPIIKGYWK